MSLGATSIFPQRNVNSSAQQGAGGVYEFAEFRLDAAHLMLYREGRPVTLAPKVVETLLALVERRGEVVGKEELMTRLWADAAVEESNLTQNIYLLRKVLGARRDGQPLIETFRRRGYRFNGEVNVGATELLVATYTRTRIVTEEISEDAPTSAPLDESGGTAEKLDFRAPGGPKRRVRLMCAAGALGLLIAAGFGWSRWWDPKAEVAAPAIVPRSGPITFRRLTPDIHADAPAISPDGRYLAYVKWEGRTRAVWLMDVTLGGAKQILPPTSAEEYVNLQFSPDGNRLYYGTSRPNVANGVIVRVPVTGGAAQEIAHNVTSPFTVSPDERQFAFMRFQDLVVAATDGGGERVLASRANSKTTWFESWGSQMSWSPDGRTIAVCGNRMERGRKRVELLEISTGDGAERQIPVPDWDYLDDVQWLPDRSGLLVIARETSGSPFQIWRVAYPGGAVSRVTNDFRDYHRVSLSADSRLLVAQQEIGQLNIWVAPLADAKRVKQLTFGSAASDGGRGLTVSPDGSVVFTSPRSGNVDLWVTNAAGGDPKQLTADAGENYRPRFTPDGRHVVFVSTRTGQNRIWRMDADGGDPKQLTDGESAEECAAVSPDGKLVYFVRSEGKTSSIWKVPIDGGEPARVSAHDRAGFPSVSPDGKLIAYSHYEENSPDPWKTGVMEAETGKTVKLYDGAFWRTVKWSADSESLIYVPDFLNLRQRPLDGGPSRQLTSFDAGRINNFDISPDFKTLVMSRGDVTTEAILITNFP